MKIFSLHLPVMMLLSFLGVGAGVFAQSPAEREKPTLLIDACFLAVGQTPPVLYYLANDGEYAPLQFGEMRRGTLNPAMPANPLLLYREAPSVEKSNGVQSLPKPAMSVPVPTGTSKILLLAGINKDRSIRTLAVPETPDAFGPASIRAINLTDAAAFIQAGQHKVQLQPLEEKLLAKDMPLREDFMLVAGLKFPGGEEQQLNAGTTWFRSPKLRMTLVFVHQIESRELRSAVFDSNDQLVTPAVTEEIVVPQLARLIDRPNEQLKPVDLATIRNLSRSAPQTAAGASAGVSPP